ncbi:hypothetical protein CARUB_v10003423mg [Capsella rubella]|uniref:FBD domain-containing protein n=1 Tax=Capsella rubella TaxID=81985 RepID=R0FL64_9BRAS|nr:hypothetical protein CARUB_v10003423mg [Capsella rubella]
MEKVESLGEVSKWEDVNRDILELIFNRTLWNTVDLTKLQELDVSNSFVFKSKVRPIFFYRYQHVDDVGGLHKNLLAKIISRSFHNLFKVEGGISLIDLLIEITKLSRTAPKNLFFNFNSYIQEKGLKFAAEKMPNIEKLALPIWCYLTENSMRFAFSQWKNLKTLIIAHEESFTGTFEFQAVGESCSNLTNLKYVGFLIEYKASEMVSYLQGLKRLSLRCSLVSMETVYKLITGLQNLTILNVSHCKYPYSYLPFANSTNNFFVIAVSKKLEIFITCRFFLRIGERTR